MKLFFSAVAFALLSLWPAAGFAAAAQEPHSESFEELARQAQAAVDSNPAEAVSLFRRALALQPAWAEGWLYLGGDLYRLKHYQESRDAFRKGIALAPDKGTAWGFLGLCEYALGDYDQALADIQKGETLGLGGNRQFEAAVRLQAAQILIVSTAFDEAMSQLQPLVRYEDMPRAVIEAVGLCVLAMPRKLAELSPSKHALAYLAGKAFWANIGKHPEEAQATLGELLEKYPQEPGVHYAYGMYLMDYDQRKALTEFQKELQANPDHWPSLLFGALLELKSGDPEAAMQLIERALKVAPERHRWICRAQLGNALLAMGQIEKAIPELEAAERVHPAYAQLHFYLQKAYRLAGRKAEADKEGAEFLRLKAQEDPLSLPGPSAAVR
jgi:tetratricopeptide (TPR) repeat protein